MNRRVAAAFGIVVLLALLAGLALRRGAPAPAGSDIAPPKPGGSATSLPPKSAQDPKPAGQAEPETGEPAAAKTRIRGRVTDQLTGAPLPGARVTASVEYPEEGASPAAVRATCDADGRYTLEVSPDIWRMDAAAEGYIPLDVAATVQDTADRSRTRACVLEAAGGDELTFDAALTPGVMVTGLVTDEGGAPIEGAAVRVTVHTIRRGQDGTGYCFDELEPYTGVSDAQGRFRLGAFFPTGTLEIRATRAGYAGKIEMVELSAGARDVRIILKRGRLIAGVVVDALGNPVAGARLLLEDPGEWNPRYGRADAQGRFRFDDAPERCSHLSAWAPGHGFAGIRFGEADAPDARLTLPACKDVSGIVTDEAGVPLPGVTVAVALLRVRGSERGTLIFDVDDPPGWEFLGGELGGQLPDDAEEVLTVTNEVGEFTLAAACPDGDFEVHLAFTLKGYGSHWLRATPREKVRVKLVKDGEGVDETQGGEDTEESED